MKKHSYRIAHIVEWDNCGQSCIALIKGDEIVARFTNYESARAAYNMAVKAVQS